MNTKDNPTKKAGKTGAKTAKKRNATATKRVDPVPPDVAAKFERKLGQLKKPGVPRIGPAGPIRKLPDGGWQMDCGNAITIAMAPETPGPFAVTGAIRDKWLEEGGAFDADGNPGKLGYPVSDTIPYTSMGREADRISRFQEGEITWNSAKNECYVGIRKTESKREESSSIEKFIDSLSLEEKFEAIELLIASIKEDTEDLQDRCDEAEYE